MKKPTKIIDDDVTVSDCSDNYEKSFIDDTPISLDPDFYKFFDDEPSKVFVNNTNLPDECFQNIDNQVLVSHEEPNSPCNALVPYNAPILDSPKVPLNKFRFCANTVFLTYPNCYLSMHQVMDHFKSKFKIKSGVVALEKHVSGEPHIHAWVQFPRKFNSRNCRIFDIDNYHPNVGFDKSYGRKSARKSKIDIFKYIIKDGIYIEYNINVKKYLQENKNHKAHIAESLVNGSISLIQAVRDEPNLIFSLSNLQRNLNLFASLCSMNSFVSRKSFWLYGSPGIGKSFSVRSQFKDLYLKLQNKWWDGYVSQKYVLLDDFDCADLSHYLKIWSDNYLFNGEIKGGSITPSYSFFFVTSNYDLNYFYSEKMLRLAMQRRFHFVNCNDFLNKDGFFDFNLAFSSFNFK